MMIGCMSEAIVNLHFTINLPKGKRTFYLKTTDVNGLWSNYIAEVQVFKQPAFYETLVGLFILYCVYYFYVCIFSITG